jgi:hypothetical protein
MAIQGAMPVEHDWAFPGGCFIVGGVEPMKDFKRSTKETVVQAVDEATGLLVWRVNVVDADDEARDTAIRVKILAPVQRVPPEKLAGTPFRPVVFEGLTARAWVNADRCQVEANRPHRCGGRVAWSFTATGMRAPSQAAKATAGANGKAAG